MKKILIVIFAAAFFASCTDKDKRWSDSVIHAKVDSIVGSRMTEMNQQSMEDLDHRMAIEVKAKADSIVQAAQLKAAKDTLKNKR